MGRRTLSAVGETFSKLTILKQETHGKHLMVYVKCECGIEKWARHSSVVKKKDVKSCGCWQNKWDRKRGWDNRSGILSRAKYRAKQKGLDFNITKEDIIIPDKCPLLGITLIKNSDIQQGNSPSLDRIDPTKGYIKGNVWVISNRANTLKNDASLQELQTLVENLKCLSLSHFS
jgi:hypothetical protein